MARVLVVEGGSDTRRLLVRWICDMGHSARAHGTPAAALDALAGERFDALLIDPHLPTIGGYEVLRTARERGLTRAPVGIASIFDPEDHPADLPYDSWLAKPFSRADVHRVVEELLAAGDSRLRPEWAPDPERARWA